MPDAPPLTKTLIPQDLHDRAYLKDWLEKPWTPEMAADVFKKLDGAESLIGKKTLIPAADAKPEEWDQLFSKLRPEKATDYEIKLGENPDEEFIATFRDAAHHAGMSKLQVQRQIEKLAPVFQAKAKAQADAVAKRDAEFETMVKTAVGNTDHEKKVSRVQAALKAHAPESVKQFIDKMDDKSLVLVVGAVNAILEKYAKEDDLGDNNGSGGGGVDKETLLAESHKLYASDAWKNFQHPDHEKTKKRIAEIFANPIFK